MVYTIGETVLDIIFRTMDDLKVKPGGAMLNTAISLARLNIKVSHVSTLSTDKASDLLIEFLENNGVSTNYILRSSRIKTSLALAYLTKQSNAEYTFYKDDLNLKNGLIFPELMSGDIIHFGSFFSINRNVHNQLHVFLDKAKKQKNVLTVYDPNFRTPHLPMLSLLMPLIEKNFKAADIVKGSDEDFKNIFKCNSGEEAWDIAKGFGVKVLFYTKGSIGSQVFTADGKAEVLSSSINVVSTIGAGDTFSAGIIYYLSKFLNSKNLIDVNIDGWQQCIKIASEFAGETCKSMDNYLSKEFCNRL